MYTFEAGKGVNVEKLNANFTESKNVANTNESKLLELSNKALRKDGSNLTQDIVTKFQQEEPVVLTNKSGNISLTDNKTHFLSLSGAGKIVLPTVNQDSFSHTITLIVDSNSYSLDLGTTNVILTKRDVNVAKTYSVLYLYHKVRRAWYYYISQ